MELIDKYGADATRFGLLLMSSTRMRRFSEECIAMGRESFANKLWKRVALVLLAAAAAERAGVRCAARRSDEHVVDRWMRRFLGCSPSSDHGGSRSQRLRAAVDGLDDFVLDGSRWYLEDGQGAAVRDVPDERHAAAGARSLGLGAASSGCLLVLLPL